MTKKERIIRAYGVDPGFNRTELARKLKCGPAYVTDILRDFRGTATTKDSDELRNLDPGTKEHDGTVAEIIEKMDSMQIQTSGKTIRTADGAMEYCGVNPDEWDISKKIVNFWDMGEHRNFQVKVWLMPKDPANIEDAIERLVERLPKMKVSPVKPLSIVKKWKKSGNLGVIANLDAHIGKLCWNDETGMGSYDVKIAKKAFREVTEENLQKLIMFKPERIMFIIGQDLMHAENFQGVTPQGGNILDTDGRLPKMIDATIDIVVESIMKCRTVAPVDIVLSPGNHDPSSSVWLVKVLKAHFKDDKHVTVDDSPLLRKAKLWGNSLICLAHEIKPTKIATYVSEFAVQFKDLWSKAEYRECLHGHFHNRQQVKVGTLATSGTMLFRQLPSLSPPDAWHYNGVFTGAVPGGTALVYSKNGGCIAEFTHNLFYRVK